MSEFDPEVQLTEEERTRIFRHVINVVSREMDKLIIEPIPQPTIEDAALIIAWDAIDAFEKTILTTRRVKESKKIAASVSRRAPEVLSEPAEPDRASLQPKPQLPRTMPINGDRINQHYPRFRTPFIKDENPALQRSAKR